MLSIIALFILSGCGIDENEVNFARCLSNSDMVMYGTEWCSHCQNMKDSFGDGWPYINYINCEEVALCDDINITSYPTFEFNDGSRLTGEIPLNILASKTGCDLY